MASAQVQVLQELDGGWLQCQDTQGVFFYNTVTKQSSDQVPNELLQQQQQPQQQPQQQMQQQMQQQVQHQGQEQAAEANPQVQVLRELGGGWLQCQDAQGVYYFNQVTQQSSDDLPAELRTPAQPPASMQGALNSYAQQAQQPEAAPASKPKLKQRLGEWMICEDAQGEFYMNARTQQSFDQPPPELVQLYRAAQQQKECGSQQAAYGAQQQKAYGAPQAAYGAQQTATRQAAAQPAPSQPAPSHHLHMWLQQQQQAQQQQQQQQRYR